MCTWEEDIKITDNIVVVLSVRWLWTEGRNLLEVWFFSFCLRIGSESFDGYRDLGEFVWEKLIEKGGRATLEDPVRV